ncbi:MAG: hypothetical protein ABJA82_02185 [Myxococcales bacterium]
MSSQATGRHMAAAGCFVIGVLGAAVAVWSISTANRYANSPNPDARSSADWAMFWGVGTAALSLGELIGGATLLGTSSDAAPLRAYYRETYAARQ